MTYPTFEEFRARVPLIDWRRWGYELNPFSRDWLSGRWHPIRSRFWGIVFALRLRVPDGSTLRFDRGSGTWCWPWQWHRRYYDARIAVRRTQDRHAHRVLELVAANGDTGGTPVPLGPPPPDLSARQRTLVRRAWRQIQREKRREQLKPEDGA